MEQRTLKLGDRIVYCYDDGSVEYHSSSIRNRSRPLVRTFGYNDRYGYRCLRISVNGKMKDLLVHRLIALAFNPNPAGLPEVDHINRDKTDNRPCNLRWADHKTNVDNRDYVDQSITKHGVRECEDRKAYNKAHRKYCLTMLKPDGKTTTSGALSPEVYNVLKPLPQRERYAKYHKIKTEDTSIE